MSFIPPPAVSHPAKRPDGFAIRRIKRFDLSKPGDLQSPLSETIYIFLIAKNLHNQKNCRIFADKERNRRNDYGKQ